MTRILAERRLCHSKIVVMYRPLYLIIGVGNTLRRDDGAGIWLAKAVAAALAERGRLVEIRLLQQLLPEIAEEIGEVPAQTVLIADCSADGPIEAEGWVRLLATTEEAGTPIGSHGLGAPALIELARGLYGFSGEAWLATVPGVDFDHGEGLSPSTQHAIDHLAPTIVGLIS